MKNKFKILAGASVFACSLGLAIGCGGGQEESKSYAVTFTSETLRLETSVTSIDSKADLNLKLLLAEGAGNRGYRLPNLTDEKEKKAIQITTGNQILTTNDFTYTIDESKTFANLILSHSKYQGDIVINAEATNIVTFTDDRLSVYSLDLNVPEDKVELRVVSNVGGYIPYIVETAEIFGTPIIGYYGWSRNLRTKQYIFTAEVEDVTKITEITVTGTVQQDFTEYLSVSFVGLETGWEYTAYRNRPQLAIMNVENTETTLDDDLIYGAVNNAVLDKDADIEADITIADYSKAQPETLPEAIVQENYYYTHELPHDVDEEGILKNFYVMGITLDDEFDIVPSNQYTYTLSADYKSAHFRMDSHYAQNYYSIYIFAHPMQVANNVRCNFDGPYHEDTIIFDRNCYRYDEALDDNDFVAEISLTNASEGHKLPDDEDENDRFYLEIDGGPRLTEGVDYDYESYSDSYAELTIYPETLLYDYDLDYAYQEDLRFNIKMVNQYDVVFEGDTQHMSLVDISDPLFQDEDLHLSLSVKDTGEDAIKYDYPETFQIPQAESDLTIVIDKEDGSSVTLTTEEFVYDSNTGDLTIEEDVIGFATKIHVKAYAERTHFLATPVVTTPEGYIDFEGNSTYLVDVDDIISGTPNKIEIDYSLTDDAAADLQKLTAHSISSLSYIYRESSKGYDVTYRDGQSNFAFAVSSSGGYKNVGTLTVPAPIDHSPSEYPFNDDLLINTNARTYDLVHDVIAVDGPSHQVSTIYSVSNTTGGSQPTGAYWLEPITNADTLTFDITYIGGGAAPVMDPDVYYLPETVVDPASATFSDYVSIISIADYEVHQEGNVVTVTIKTGTGKDLANLAGNILFDMYGQY